MMSGSSMIIATTPLVGFALAADKSLSTLPLAAQFIAMMLTTIPAALLLQKIGRKKGLSDEHQDPCFPADSFKLPCPFR